MRLTPPRIPATILVRSSHLWMIGAIMTHDVAVLKAREIASHVLAPAAGQNDKAGRFSTEAVEALGESGLLGLLLPADFGGAGLGPRAFAAVMATLAEADASVAMVYLMHLLGAATIAAARLQAVTPILQEISEGRHLSTLAFKIGRASCREECRTRWMVY